MALHRGVATVVAGNSTQDRISAHQAIMYKRLRRTEPRDGSSPSGPMGSWVQRGGEKGKGKRRGETPSAGGAAAVVSLKARQGEKKESIPDM